MRRDRFTVIADVIASILHGKDRPLSLMYAANLSLDQRNQYRDYLIEKNFISFIDLTFHVKSSGVGYLRAFRQFRDECVRLGIEVRTREA